GWSKSWTAERIRAGLEKLRRELRKRGFALAAAPITEIFRGIPQPAVPDGLGAKILELPSVAAQLGPGGAGPLTRILGVVVSPKPWALAGAALAVLSIGGWGIARISSRPAVPAGGRGSALAEAPKWAGARGGRPGSRSAPPMMMEPGKVNLVAAPPRQVLTP